jgi:hypothetical protein
LHLYESLDDRCSRAPAKALFLLDSRTDYGYILAHYHPNFGSAGAVVKREPPDSEDDGGFCVSMIAGGLFLLAAAIGEKEKRAIEIGAIMGADQRLGVNTIWELASK